MDKTKQLEIERDILQYKTHINNTQIKINYLEGKIEEWTKQLTLLLDTQSQKDI